MAMDALKKLIDNSLEAVFHRPARDPAKARKPLLKGIDRALAQWEAGGGAKGGRGGARWWKERNGVVALTVKVKGDTFDINGVATNHMPADRFVEFLGQMRDAVEAGEFDAELANKGNGDAEVHIPKKRSGNISTEAARERGRRAAATRAANKAKRAAG